MTATAFNPTDLEAHYAAIRARLRPTPRPSVFRPPSAPTSSAPTPIATKPFLPSHWKDRPIPKSDHVPSRQYTEAEEAALDAQIERNQQLLAGCGISGRLKMLLLPILQRRNVTWMQMLRGGRAVCYRDCKREVWMMLYDEGLSYPQIGKLFGNDHTSILHGVKAWREAQECLRD